MVAPEKARVLVLGAGFGGLTFCKRFHHPNATVTLIDRTNHHLFQPLLYQVATAGLSAPDIAQPDPLDPGRRAKRDGAHG